MQLNQLLPIACLFGLAYSHGLVTAIQGANGVTMPGLGLIDGTPRDCSTKGCGAEQDTPIFKKQNTNPLGKTRGGGQINAAADVAQFMGTAANASAAAQPAAAAANTAADNQAEQQEDAQEASDAAAAPQQKRQAADATPVKTQPGTVEKGVAAAAGSGAQSGLPTADQNGVVTMSFHQVNGDGAGPYTATIDPSSGGTNETAFQPAQLLSQIPGKKNKDKANKASDFQVQVQMPQGMTCTGQVGGVQGVCVVRMKNSAKAGPFGGSAVFQQQQQQAAGSTGGSQAAAPVAARRTVPMRFEARK